MVPINFMDSISQSLNECDDYCATYSSFLAWVKTDAQQSSLVRIGFSSLDKIQRESTFIPLNCDGSGVCIWRPHMLLQRGSPNIAIRSSSRHTFPHTHTYTYARLHRNANSLAFHCDSVLFKQFPWVSIDRCPKLFSKVFRFFIFAYLQFEYFCISLPSTKQVSSMFRFAFSCSLISFSEGWEACP